MTSPATIDLSDPPPERRWRRPLLAFAFWTVAVVIYATILHLQIPLPLSLTWRQGAVYFYSLAVILIPVGRWSAWFMSRRRSAPVALLGHLGVGLVAVAMWQGAIMLYFRVELGPAFWQIVYAQSWMFQLLSALTTYGCVRGVMLTSQAWTRERERERREAALVVAARYAELAAIKTQFQPHFVLNALNSLLALIDRDPALARTMVVRLSDLMKAVFDRADVREVALERELDLVRAYLDVERIRLGARLSVQFDIDDAARGVMVPPFLLQPLVENAVKHGVAPFARPGLVRVIAHLCDDRVHLTIGDSGGAGPSTQLGTGPSPSLGTGLGLQLTRRRLDTVYGERYQMTFDREAGGTKVHLDLPADHRDVA